MRLKVEQLEYEKDRWKRLVEFIQLENSYCKNRLAEVIRTNDADGEFLEQAEFYQSYFIQQDAHLSLLKHDLSNFGRLLDDEKFLDGMIASHVLGLRGRLHREIHKLESDFHAMREKFNGFIEANM